MEDATAVLILESNLGFEASHILHAFEESKMPKWVALSEGVNGTLGWLTTHERKEKMMFQMRDLLQIGNFHLSSDFFSLTMSVDEAQRKIREELCRFAIIVEAPKTAFGKVKRTYTGKVSGQQDDLAVAMQLALTGLRTFYTNPRYASIAD